MLATREEVSQQVVTGRSENALGVELHTLHVEFTVAHSHDEPVTLGRDLEYIGQRRAIDHQRVIPRRLER